MVMPTLQVSFARMCFETRIALDLTQQQVADRVGVSRSYIAKVERETADPALSMVERIAEALGLGITFDFRPPRFPVGRPIRDALHARCSAYVDRRLRARGLITAREVEIVHGASHGWIDILAFDPVSGTLLVIEIKTRFDDLGALERQVSWYERMAWQAARRLGWRPRRVVSLVLALASDEVESVVRVHRDVFRLAFPVRAAKVAAMLLDPSSAISGRGLALIDPASRRRHWLIGTSLDGRRSRLPYRDYADAARPAASSMARAPADTNEPSEPRPMNRKPMSSRGGRATAS